MARQIFNQRSEAVAGEAVRNAPKETQRYAHVTVDVQIDGEGGAMFSDQAASAIQTVLRREAERIAQIAAVDLKDQAVAQRDAQKNSNIPRARPMIIAAAGSKDPASVQTFWQNEQGQLSDEPAKIKAFAKNGSKERVQ